MAWDSLPPTAEELGTASSSSSSAPTNWASTAPTDAELGIQEALGQLDAAARGTLQGMTMGFGDEIVGGGSAAVQKLLQSIGAMDDRGMDLGQLYTEARDEERKSNAAAQEANPWTYGATNLVGAVGTGLAAGGAGLIGRGAGALGATGTEAALANAAAGGTLKGLATIGGLEGAAGGLGTSDADLTKGEFGQAAKDTATGAALGVGTAGLIKGIQGGYQGVKALGKATPILGDVGEHLGKVAEQGSKNLGKSFKQTASESLGELTESTEDLAAKALAQKAKYADDLKAGSVGANRQAFKAAEDFKDEMSRALDVEGKALETIDDKIAAYSDSLPDNLNITEEGLKASKFDFSPLDESFEEAIKDYQGSPTGNILSNIQDKIKGGDYREVTKQLRKLNSIIGDAPRDLQPTLLNIKKSMEQTIDTHLQTLPGDVGKQLYGARMDKAKDYSLLASARDALKTEEKKSTADLLRKASFMANPESPEGLELSKYLSKVYQTGDQSLTEAANKLKQSADTFNKFQVFNPEKGKMGLGKNEDLYQLYSEVFGEPQKYGVSSKTASTLQDLGQQSEGVTSLKKQKDLTDWIRQTYGDKADEVLAELKAKSDKFQTLKAGLKDEVEAGQDVSSMIRLMKKAADPLAFMGGKAAQSMSNKAEQLGVQNLGNATTPLRAAQTYRNLTQPAEHKRIVDEFKQSQQNNGVTPEK